MEPEVALLIGLIFLSFAGCLLCMVLPKWSVGIALLIPFPTALTAFHVLTTDSTYQFQLLGSFGVQLLLDPFAAWFLLTNALVNLAVVTYCSIKSTPSFLYTLMVLLHGSVNAVFVSNDLFTTYVAIELSTIIAFALICHPTSSLSMWNAMRYLIISNIGMLFYLVGALIVYQSTLSFALPHVANSPAIASALLIIGLMIKGGVFIPGLWLPFAHSRAATPVSAMLSGTVINIGIFPLLKLAMLSEPLGFLIRSLGIGSAFLGLLFACFENDLKRLLAFSTVSQVGFILAAPYAGAFYALCHGLTKASLFLCCGNLPTHKLQVLNKDGVSTPCFVILLLGGFSLVGMPLFGTFSAKTLMLETLHPWQQPLILAASIGTAVYTARFSFIRPRRDKKTAMNLLVPSYLLIGGALAIGLIAGPFSPMLWLKSLLVAISGWTAGLFMLRYVRVSLPLRLERFQDLLGFSGAVLLVMILVVGA